MAVERNRLRLADTLGAMSPIAGAALASAAATARHNPSSMGAPTGVPLVNPCISKGAPQLKIEPVTKPVSPPLSLSPNHSASLSTSHSVSLSLDQPQSQSLGQASVADRLTANQSVVLRYLIETRPYIVRFVQLGQAVGLCKDTTRTILRRLMALGFIKFQRARDGQLQGVNVSFNASLCEQFTQGHSLGQSLDQPASRPLSQPLTSKKMDLEEEINPSEAVAEKLAKLTDEQIASNWSELATSGFRAHDLKEILENLSALGISAAGIVEGLNHGEYELQASKFPGRPPLIMNGKEVKNIYRYIRGALFKSGYYRRPEGYVSPAEQEFKDREEEAKRLVEAKKRTEDAEYQAWNCNLTPEERKAILSEGPAGLEDFKLKYAWRKRQQAKA